ncbi:hypothetical protein [Candidatus Magnetominusculus dajiuhuensis]|uniref:hypothetical protein n=1 Tax=Candidatus Magnetominusculus dajiuhuensis TaxID=3137712 RepID=UPI0019F61723|nr:hypothetical protein [Nitrospirota bacterium]
MLKISLTDDEKDLLKETFNLALGQAGDKLARLLKSFVDLSVPEIEILEAERVAEKVLQDTVFSVSDSVTALAQSFSHGTRVDGEAVVIFNSQTVQTVAGIFGLDSVSEHSQKIEIMLELTNIIAGACLNGIANQLFNGDMSFKPPVVLADNIDLTKFVYSSFQRSQLNWDHTLMVKITFNLKDKQFKSDLLIFVSEQAIEAVRKALQRLLSEM